MSIPYKYTYAVLTLFLLNCYTFEFLPSPEYPNLRKNNPKNVILTTVRPREEFSILGTLVVHDFSGNILEPSFQSAIKREAKKRGAEGAWISKITLNKAIQFQGRSMSNSRSYMQNNYYNTGEIRGTIGIVEVVLFNFLSSPAIEKEVIKKNG